jgi:hypothetical protein
VYIFSGCCEGVKLWKGEARKVEEKKKRRKMEGQFVQRWLVGQVLQ